MKGYIYKHTGPSGKSYIGQTLKVNPEERWKQGRGYSSNAPFSKAIRRYGWENFTHQILWEGEVSSLDELNQLEEGYILGENTLIPFGYNLCTKGENHLTSESTRIRIGDKSRGRSLGKHWYTDGEIEVHTWDCPEGFHLGRLPVSDKTREKLKEIQSQNPPMLGKHHSPESRLLISKAAIGRKRPKVNDETRKKISLIHKGKVLSVETRKKISDSVKKSLTPELRERESEIHRIVSTGRHWYTNGVENRFVYECPNGFWPGKIIKSSI